VSAKNIEKMLQAGQLGQLGYWKTLYSIKKKKTKKQQNHTGTFLYLTQVKAVLFAVILATSYYWLAPPLLKSHMVFTVSNSTMCTS